MFYVSQFGDMKFITLKKNVQIKIESELQVFIQTEGNKRQLEKYP